MQVKKQQLEQDMEQWTGLKLGKEYIVCILSVYCHPAYLTHMQSTLCKMPGWIYHNLESRLLGEIQTTSDTQMIPSNSRKWRGMKEPLGDGERGEWKSWLETQHSKNRSWLRVPSLHGKKKGKNWSSDIFYFLGSKFTADGDYKHKMQRHLLLGRKSMTNLDRVLKSRDISLPTKYSQSLYSQSYDFSSSHVWLLWELDHKDGWGLKNWYFWIMVLEKSLESPWTKRRSDRSI